MKILQQAVKVKRHSRVNVHFDKPCTIYLMTEVNFKRYKDGASFRRLGGPFDKSPAEFVAPYDGTWHAVIERGSHFNPINVSGRVEVLAPLMKDTPYLFDEEPASNDEEVTDEVAIEESDENEEEEKKENKEDDEDEEDD